jgi:pimeloyl-ACP methyl ester carboxylesterase
MYMEQGGEGPDLLLLLHGMGATGAVWSPLRATAEDHRNGRWPGRWLAPDLPGHGRSARQDSYAIGQHAASVARAVLPHIDPAGRLVVLGHSLGGVIGLALATGWFGLAPHRVFAAGIKVAWSDDELRRMETLAAQPARRFATEEEALQRSARARNWPQPPSTSCPAESRSLVRMPRSVQRAGDRLTRRAPTTAG